MNIECSGIGKDDVFEIFFSKKDELISTGKIYRLNQVLKALEHLSSTFSGTIHSSLQQQHGIDLSTNNLLSSGIVCKVLSSESSGWKPGKLEIRIQLDFVPDISEVSEDVDRQESNRDSDLDELRKFV